MSFFYPWRRHTVFFFFFFNDTATTEIYTLSLHDALPIWRAVARHARGAPHPAAHRRRRARGAEPDDRTDRKSTRLNSSHSQISYAVFCLKKKKYPHSTETPVNLFAP